MTDSELPEAVAVNNEVSVADNGTNDASTATNSTTSVAKLPQKRFFRQRAHANPFSDHLLE